MLVCIAIQMQAQVYSALNFTMVSHIDPEPNPNPSGDKYSACWGWYQASLNKEYAIACSQSGTYWIDVSNPATPTVSCYRLGAHTGATWREVKTYQNFCYVASDDGGTNRFQIFDMQYLPDSVHKVYDSQALFKRGHTLYVDSNKLYVASVTYSNNSFSSMNVYSLANPQNPVLIRRLDQDYPAINHVHDMYVRNDTVYASCGYDKLNIFRLTAANTFTMISNLVTYPFSGYNHSSALTPNGHTLVFLDEVPNSLPVKVADVTNLQNIQVLATINQYPNTTPHNPFIVNNQYCFVSAYQDGLQLFDISNPSSPFLAGFFDTYPQSGGNNNTWPSGGGYEGQWGAYPFFPSKNIFALDQSNGVFMLSTHLYHNPAPSPTVSFSAPGTVCAGSSISFSNTTIGASSYQWTFQGGNPSTSTLSNPSVTYTLPGVYSIILSASNGSAQSTSNSTITVEQLSAAVSLTHATCATCPNGSASVSPTGGTAPFSYTWIPSGGSASLATGLTPGCYTVQLKDFFTCSASKTLCISHTTGWLEQYEQFSEVLLYPNPAHQELNLVLNALPCTIRLFNQLGQMVLTSELAAASCILNLASLPVGLYCIEFDMHSGTIRKKLIIE